VTQRFHQLDGLRAIACLMVVATHSGMKTVGEVLRTLGPSYFADLVGSFFASGVELFFVLSGSVLLRAYLRDEKPFQPGVYAYRRLSRVYPPYLVCLAISVPLLVVAERFPTWYSAEILPPFRWPDFLRQIPLVWPTDVFYNVAWWTLQIEALFYLAAPLVVLAWSGRPFRVGTALAVGAVCLVISLIDPAVWLPRLAEAAPLVFKTLRFSFCFFMGVVIAKTDLSPRVAWLLVAAGAVWVLLAPVVPRIGFPVGFGLLYGGILALALRPDTRLARWLSQPLLVWLGERSYSMFLVHFTVFYLTNYVVSLFVPGRNAVYGVLTRGIGLPLAMLAAMVLFHVVERRFARGLVTADCFWPTTFLRRAAGAGREGYGKPVENGADGGDARDATA
jgi:peptidoglycan/LPS O-acetylase OafA/YrhL